jgi:hypothetical protein
LTFPGTGFVPARTVRDIVIDPDNANAIYVTNLTDVFQSLDGGATWTTITGDLQTFAPIALRAIAYVPRTGHDQLVVSTFNGIYVARESSGFTDWKPLGAHMPNVPIFDLHYDAENGELVAGTLGRGAWKIKFGN